MCFELKTGCCGSVRTTVCIALCHYILYGAFVVCFVFSNISSPPLYYPDYAYGGSGGALLLFSFISIWIVDSKKCQFFRGLFGCLTVLSVLAVVVTSYYYAVVRWHDIEVTILAHAIRPPFRKDYPDYFWYTLVVISCASAPTFLVYVVYILSFMCHPWKSHLFLSPYINDERFSSLPPAFTVPRDVYSSRSYKPYPVQMAHHT